MKKPLLTVKFLKLLLCSWRKVLKTKLEKVEKEKDTIHNDYIEELKSKLHVQNDIYDFQLETMQKNILHLKEENNDLSAKIKSLNFGSDDLKVNAAQENPEKQTLKLLHSTRVIPFSSL